MNTMATFCTCPFDGMYGHLPICPTFAPTQSEASETAEGEDSKWACKECRTVKADGGGHHPACPMRPFGYEPPSPDSSDAKPADDLEQYFHLHGERLKLPETIPGTVMMAIEEYAQHKLQAQSPAAIIDEFVKELERYCKEEGDYAIEIDRVRSVAAEMKGEKTSA